MDEVWLDESDPLPLYMHANVGSEIRGEHTIHVKLADGCVFTVHGVEVGGESKEVAVAEARTLSASLVKREDSALAKEPKAPLDASLHPALAVVLTLLAVEFFPEIFAQAAGKIALTFAAFLLGQFVLPAVTGGGEVKGSTPTGGVEIVLKAEEVMTRPKALSNRRQSGEKMPRRNPIYERRLSFADAQRKSSRNILVEGIPFVDPLKPPEGGDGFALVPDTGNVDRVNFSGQVRACDIKGSVSGTSMHNVALLIPLGRLCRSSCSTSLPVITPQICLLRWACRGSPGRPSPRRLGPSSSIRTTMIGRRPSSPP